MFTSEQSNITIIGTVVFLYVSKLLVSFNSIFALQTFRSTPQNLQRLLTFLIFFLSITNSPMFSAKPRLKYLLLIILMTSKSIWKKMLNLLLALYTLFQHPNKRLLRNLLRKTLIWILFNQPSLCMVHWSYSSRRKMVHYAFVSTFVVLTVYKDRYLLLSSHC